jgi:hypothetical protein
MENIYHFRRRSNKTSCDPYNVLSASKSAPPRIFFDEQTSSVWSNGDVSIVSKMNTSEESISTILTSTLAPDKHDNNIGLKPAQRKPDSAMEPHINGVHEVRNSIVAGSIAGMASVTLFHPLDVIRTKMQSTTRLVAVDSATATSRQAAATLLSTTSAAKNHISSSSGALAVFSHTVKNGGMRAFYTGFSFPLAAQACYKSTVFTVNRVSQNLITEMKTRERWKIGNFTPYQLNLYDHFLCGSISGAINALVFVAPVEYVRSQLISQHTHIAQGTTSKLKHGVMTGPADLVRATLKTDGVFGLWRGAGVTLVRDSIGCGSFFVFFALGQKHLPAITGSEPSAQINTIGAGMCAGLGYWTLSLPLDALKTLVQTGKATSAFSTASLLVGRDGLYGAASQLYRGWQLAVGRGMPSAAVTVTVYAAVYNLCNTRLG